MQKKLFNKLTCHCEESMATKQSIICHAELVSASQSGRSMVEMLGVLAVMGVLSVAGIAGYRNAIINIAQMSS